MKQEFERIMTVSVSRFFRDPFVWKVIQGSVLTLEEIERQMALYQSKTIAERREIVGLQPKRADVILAGAIIVSVIMKKAGVNDFTVSDRGLRHGLIVDRFA